MKTRDTANAVTTVTWILERLYMSYVYNIYIYKCIDVMDKRLHLDVRSKKKTFHAKLIQAEREE